MSGAFIILILASAVLGACALLALAWLCRSLRWEEVDDDQLHDRIAQGRTHGGWLKRWLKPKRHLLTYRRDDRGRFRRYRR